MQREGQRAIVLGDSMGISFRTKGDFKKTEKFLKKSLGKDYISIMKQYGELGVEALKANSPIDTGLMASSWRYEITQKGSSISLEFHNDDVENGQNVAILVQYGHALKNGYYILGRDFINPALQPIFDDLAEKAWKEVTRV